MSYDLAPVEGLETEQLMEMANLFAEKCQVSAQVTIRNAAISGNALNIMKTRIPHGEWVSWLVVNWDLSRQTAMSYMTLAANVKRFTFEPTSIRDALRLITEQPGESAEDPIVPRANRKNGQVEVTKVGQQFVQPESEDGPDSTFTPDDDPNPAPKSNTRHSKGTRKAKEAERAVPGIVSPAILMENDSEGGQIIETFSDLPEKTTLSDFTLDDIFEFLNSVAGGNAKEIAKRLRDIANEIDPPRKFRSPDLNECIEFFSDKGSDQGETFFDFYESKGWLVGKVSMKKWQAAARKWIRENQSTGKNGNGRQSSAQIREQGNCDSFTQLRLASGQQ